MKLPSSESHMTFKVSQYWSSITWGGISKQTCMSSSIWELLNFHLWIKSTFCNVWITYFVWNFKGTLWNSTQNILPIHWKIWFLYNTEILKALRFESSYAFLKRPPAPIVTQFFYGAKVRHQGALELPGKSIYSITHKIETHIYIVSTRLKIYYTKTKLTNI